MKSKRIKLDAQEIVKRVGCSLRHARRLRAVDDERCFVEASVFDGETRTQPTFAENSVLGAVRKILDAYSDGSVLSFCLRHDPDKYSDHPINSDEILEALEGAANAISNIERVAGFYYDGGHNGEVTIYQLAQQGGRVHRYDRARVLAWAEKYNQPLNVTFYGHEDGLVPFDDNDNEIPAPPDEVVNTYKTPTQTTN
jgi:hypothetical protein